MSKKSKKAKAKYKSQIKMQATNRDSGIKQAHYKPNIDISITSISQQLNEQYNYITPELIRIGIISGILLIILIVLSFIIK